MSALASDGPDEAGHHAKLIRMANQIAAFFHSYPEAEGIEGVAEHLNKFWSRPMRLDIHALAAGNAPGIDPLVTKALAKVKG